SGGALRGCPSTPATKSASNARSPHDTSRSSSGAPPGARTSGPNGPHFRSPACVTPPPTSPGPCTGATATFASTSTSQWLPHTESKICATRQLTCLHSGWGQLQPSRRGQFRLTSPPGLSDWPTVVLLGSLAQAGRAYPMAARDGPRRPRQTYVVKGAST